MSGRIFLRAIACGMVILFHGLAFAQDELDLILLPLAEEPVSGERIPLEAAAAPIVPEAQAILDECDAEIKELRRAAKSKIDGHRQTLIKTLQGMQDHYTRQAMLDEAVAIRDQLNVLRFAHLHPRRNPGNLSRLAAKKGKTFYFDVTGINRGAVWGTDVYTCDSHLAAAAVHAGAVKLGKRGVVKVTIVESPDFHSGSQRHGVVTHPFGPFGASYTIERAVPEDTIEDDEAFDSEVGESIEMIHEAGGGWIIPIDEFRIRPESLRRGAF